MDFITKLLVFLGILCVGFSAGAYFAWQPLPFERMHNEYNYIKLHEDGSYEGETREGIPFVGCIPKALCDDSNTK